jgi:hypothetical protein
MATDQEDLHLFDAMHRNAVAMWAMRTIGKALLLSVALAVLAGVAFAEGEAWLGGLLGLASAAAVGWMMAYATPPDPPLRILEGEHHADEDSADPLD